MVPFAFRGPVFPPLFRGLMPGGVNKNLSLEERDAPRAEIDAMIEWSVEGLELCKKVVLADGISVFANPVFSAAETSMTLSFAEPGVVAWPTLYKSILISRGIQTWPSAWAECSAFCFP